jgi:hypothetical protein
MQIIDHTKFMGLCLLCLVGEGKSMLVAFLDRIHHA